MCYFKHRKNCDNGDCYLYRLISSVSQISNVGEDATVAFQLVWWQSTIYYTFLASAIVVLNVRRLLSWRGKHKFSRPPVATCLMSWFVYNSLLCSIIKWTITLQQKSIKTLSYITADYTTKVGVSGSAMHIQGV